MNSDFIRIQSLQGELKTSHKRSDVGMTVSTEELVLQKPHMNYHIRLEDIVSIVPFSTENLKSMRLINRDSFGNELTNVARGQQHYKFYVSRATVYNRTGVSQMGPAEFILPILSELLSQIGKYSGLNLVQTS